MAKTLHILIGLCLLIGALNLASVEAAPAITSFNNSISDDSIYPHVQPDGSVQFNISIDESVNYTWYKDNTNQNHNYNNFSTSWSSSGQKNITIVASNVNGSVSMSWWVLVEQRMATGADTIDELNMTAYDNILSIVGSDSPDYEDFLYTLSIPHQNIIGSVFFILLFGVPFLYLWVGSGSAKLPAAMCAMIGPVLLSFWAPNYIPVTILLVLLTLFGIVYQLFKERNA